MPPLRNTTFVSQPASQIPQVKPRDPFAVLGISFILISLLMSGAAYGAGYILENQGNTIEQEIKGMKGQFPDSQKLREMLNFYGKVTSINQVLRQHTYTTNILNTISYNMDPLVHFRRFDLSYKDATGYQLSLTGVTRNYDAVVRQVDLLKKEIAGKEQADGTKSTSVFTSLEVKSISADQNNNVNFDLVLGVTPTLRDTVYPSAQASINPSGSNANPATLPSTGSDSSSTSGDGSQGSIPGDLFRFTPPQGTNVTPGTTTDTTTQNQDNSQTPTESSTNGVDTNQDNTAPVADTPMTYE